jgi:hypothetical protein
VVESLRNPARRKAMGQAARNRVVQDYDVKALERSLAGVFRSLQQSIVTEAGKALTPVG